MMESKHKNKTEHPQNKNADTVVPLINPDGAQHMERHVQHAERSTTTERCAQVAGTRVQNIDLQVEQPQDEDEVHKVNINFIYIDSISLNSKQSVKTEI